MAMQVPPAMVGGAQRVTRGFDYPGSEEGRAAEILDTGPQLFAAAPPVRPSAGAQPREPLTSRL